MSKLHDTIIFVHPSLARGRVWCKKCGSTKAVSSSRCMTDGWPECCGETMTIDSPEEQARLSTQAQHTPIKTESDEL